MSLAGQYVRSSDVELWTPTWTNLSLGTGPTQEGYYFVSEDRAVTAHYHLIVGTGGSWSGTTSFTLPVTCITGTLDMAIGSFVYRDNSLTDFYAGTVVLLSATEARCVGLWSGTLPVDILGQGGTSPVALAVSDKVSVQLSYLAA